MTSSTTPPRRRRGAPPGNKNALKHGFNAAKFWASLAEEAKTGSTTTGDALSLEALDTEIRILRLYIRRTADLGRRACTTAQILPFLQALARANKSLAELLLVRKSLTERSTRPTEP